MDCIKHVQKRACVPTITSGNIALWHILVETTTRSRLKNDGTEAATFQLSRKAQDDFASYHIPRQPLTLKLFYHNKELLQLMWIYHSNGNVMYWTGFLHSTNNVIPLSNTRRNSRHVHKEKLGHLFKILGNFLSIKNLSLTSCAKKSQRSTDFTHATNGKWVTRKWAMFQIKESAHSFYTSKRNVWFC